MLMLNRAFFSLQSPWIPTWVALGNLGLNAVLDAAFYRFGIWGIPLATSLREHRRHGRAARAAAPAARDDSSCARAPRAFVRIVAASAVAGAVAYGVWRGLDEELGRSRRRRRSSRSGRRCSLPPPPTALACRALGVHELQALLSLRRRRE